MRQLTDDEYKVMDRDRSAFILDIDLEDIDPLSVFNGAYSGGFIAGLDFKQAQIDRLLAYIRGETPMSEIENDLRPVLHP